MVTTELRLKELVAWVLTQRMDDLREDRDVPPTVLFLHDGVVLGVLEMPWGSPVEKEFFVVQARALAEALLVDGLVFVADAYVSTNPDLAPSQDPHGREALFALGFLSDERLFQVTLVYGRSDEGHIYVDTEASRAKDAVTSGPGAVLDGFLASGMAGVARVRAGGDVIDAQQIRRLVVVLEAGGGLVSFDPALDVC